MDPPPVAGQFNHWKKCIIVTAEMWNAVWLQRPVYVSAKVSDGSQRKHRTSRSSKVVFIS